MRSESAKIRYLSFYHSFGIMSEELRIKAEGTMKGPHGDIPVIVIGEENPTDYEGFDALNGAKILSWSGNQLDIEKEGRKDRYFLGTVNDALFLKKFQTGAQISGYDLSNSSNLENPFEGLAGSKVTRVGKEYFSLSDRANELPFEVVIKFSNGLNYHLSADDEVIMVARYDTSESIRRERDKFIGKGDARVVGSN
jgi:hypothetical protein